jgi:hypothetical protein
MEITPNELIVLLGYKEAEIFKLRQRIAELEAGLMQSVKTDSNSHAELAEVT